MKGTLNWGNGWGMISRVALELVPPSTTPVEREDLIDVAEAKCSTAPRMVRLTATAGNVVSNATVKINSDTSYGILRWVTQ